MPKSKKSISTQARNFRKSIYGPAALFELDIKVAVFDPVLFMFLNTPRGRVKSFVLGWRSASGRTLDSHGAAQPPVLIAWGAQHKPRTANIRLTTKPFKKLPGSRRQPLRPSTSRRCKGCRDTPTSTLSGKTYASIIYLQYPATVPV